MGLEKITRILNKIVDPKTKRAIKNYVGHHKGTSVPLAGSSGYMPGAKFNLLNVVLGQCPTWVNVGTEASCVFVPTGITYGYGFVAAGGPTDCVNGSAAITLGEGLVHAPDIAFGGHAVSDDNDQIISIIATAAKNYITLTGSADPLTAHDYVWAALRDNCAPTWDIFAAGTHTTLGTAAAEAITVTGVLATDIAFACYSATDDTDTISDVLCSADTVTVTCSADPSTTHGLHYVVLRPRGTFKPSHYVAYAGAHTTVGTAAAEAITVTGAAATDIPMVNYHTTDDTDSVLKAVVTANTLTVTCSADPSTAHGLNYALLRAY